MRHAFALGLVCVALAVTATPALAAASGDISVSETLYVLDGQQMGIPAGLSVTPYGDLTGSNGIYSMGVSINAALSSTGRLEETNRVSGGLRITNVSSTLAGTGLGFELWAFLNYFNVMADQGSSATGRFTYSFDSTEGCSTGPTCEGYPCYPYSGGYSCDIPNDFNIVPLGVTIPQIGQSVDFDTYRAVSLTLVVPEPSSLGLLAFAVLLSAVGIGGGQRRLPRLSGEPLA